MFSPYLYEFYSFFSLILFEMVLFKFFALPEQAKNLIKTLLGLTLEQKYSLIFSAFWDKALMVFKGSVQINRKFKGLPKKY